MRRTWTRLGAVTGGYVAATSGLVGIYSWLDFKFFENLGWRAWAVSAAILAYFICILITLLTVERIHKNDFAIAKTARLYDAIPAIVKESFRRGDYREVIRFGDALSRPLFESGEFEIRLKVGSLTEEAAAHVGAIEVQYRSLIDAIGWSLIELGSFSEANTKIRHGRELAAGAGDAFYESKALRHLGAIERRRGRNESALQLYEEAAGAAARIGDEELKLTMEAGIEYAIAHLEFSMRQFDKSLMTTERAINRFRSLGDVYRVDMALVLKADVQAAVKQNDRARDTYRGVIQSSRLNREAVHYVRAVLGLVDLYLLDGQKEEAATALEQLEREHVLRMPAFRDRYVAASAAVSQPKVAGP
ncbi:hypothetical protein CH252_21155 [Rhodococcus sp. 06-1477-1B]|nr:hypothetical protein CH252_21155 [Rhodococcus sp. 06-1477-1B]